jgi:DNA repair photolyase
MTTTRDFIEIESKSVVNRVKGMPFRWSINPYRGCSHGCVFCLSGETPILMTDGTTRRLDAIQVGEEVIGTLRRGFYRHYVGTSVLECWTTEKPAFRVTLADGTELIASGDHRFLTNRGWKFVTGEEQGANRRPHLTINNALIGPGTVAAEPAGGADYQRGYLCGLIRGDGLLRSYEYDRAGRVHGNSWQFRLALADREPLVRARQYLSTFGVQTRSFNFALARANWRRMDGIRTSARRHVELIQNIVAWPQEPAAEWSKGFLAGIFDAEGSYSNGVLRISNTDQTIVEWIKICVEQFGFPLSIENRSNGKNRPITVVRLKGGLRQHLRFFHTVCPTIGRKCRIDGHAVKNARSRVVAIQPLGIRRLFDITTGTGDFVANGIISHNCYARRTHWFLDEDGVNQWSSKIFVKVNAAEVLRKELSRRGWKRERVALGTATDPYQAIEGKYKITRRILEVLCEYRTPVSIVTRSPMIVRDIDVLSRIAHVADVTACLSIATTDPNVAREIEPTVAPPAQRFQTIETLASAGIRAGVLLAPILPGITDDPKSLESVVESARRYGAHFVWHNTLHLGDVTRDAFLNYLREKRPDLLPLYQRMYARKYAPLGYRTAISRVVERLRATHHVAQPRYVEPAHEPRQMLLL